MTPKPLRRPSSIAPEIAVVFTLAVLSLAPLLLSSGVESLDDVFYGRSYSLFTLEPLVGLDSFLHWTARLLLMVGVLNVVVRRVRPLLLFHLRLDLRRASGPREGTALHRIAGELGVLPDVRVVSSEHGPLVFTAGVMRPRIYLSGTVLACLTPTELDLVLRHEVAHCKARDPLRSMMATVLGDLFFWLPMAQALIRRVITKIEVNADEAAASVDRLALAGTILKVASLTAVEAPRGVVHFSPSHGTVPWRVRRLIHSERGAGEELGDMRVKGTALILLALWALGLTAYGTHNAHQEMRPGSEVHSFVLTPSDGAASPIGT